MSLVSGILDGVEGAKASFSSQLQANQNRESMTMARQRQDNANEVAARDTRNDDARTAVGNVDAHLSSIGKKPTSWNKTNGAELQRTNPTALVDLLNGPSGAAYRSFNDEGGNKVAQSVDSVRYDKKEGSYVLMMRRDDTGAVAPLTVKASENGTDGVQKLDLTAFDNLVNSAYQGAVGHGGLENTNSWLASSQDMQANMAKQKVLDKAVEEIEGVDNLRVFRAEVDKVDLDDPDALETMLEIYKGINGDADALRAEGQTKADAIFAKNQAEQGGIAEGSLQELLASKGVDKETWNSYTPDEKVRAAERLSTSQGLRSLWDRTGGAVASEVADLAAQPGKAAASAWDSVKTSGPGRFLGLSDYNSVPGESPDYNENSRANQAEVSRQDGTITVDQLEGVFNRDTTNPTGVTPKGISQPGNSAPVIAAPNFELSARGVREAILNSTSEPTNEQREQVLAVLETYGIDNQSQLEQALKDQTLNRQQGMSIAWVMAASDTGDASEKAKLAQNLTNLVDRNDQNVGTLQAAQLDSAAASGRAATLNAQTNLQQVRLDASRFDNDQAREIALVGATALQKMYQDLGMVDADGDPTSDTFSATSDEARVIARRIPNFVKRLKLAQGPQEVEAGMSSLNAMVGLYMQAKAASDPNGILSGETYKDIFRKQPNGSVDFDGANIRVAKRNAAGSVTKVAYVRGGVLSEAVSVGDLVNDEANIAALLIATAEANTKKESAAK